MTIRLLDYDPITGIKTWHDYDPLTKETHVHTTYEHAQTDAVLDENKRLQNDGTNGWSTTREWKYIANIPISVLHSWLINEGFDAFDPNNAAKLKQKLNSSEWRHLRTSGGVF